MAIFELLSRFLNRLHQDQEGQALVEYALILALVAVVVVVVLVALGSGVHHTLTNVSNAISNSVGG